MHLTLFVVGIVLALTGAFLVYSSVPVVDVAPAALFNSGIIAIVGGLILMALAAVLRSVGRIAERFEMQPLPLPPVASVGRDDPAPRPARAAASGEAPRRPSLLSWFGSASPPAPDTAKAPPAAPDAAAAPQVDLAPLARGAEEPRVVVPPPAAAPPSPRPPAPPLRAPPKPAATAPAPASADATVYKSGVIDGMAYSLFMDGSIEAELPQGKVKFASVDELQKYLTTR